MRRLTLRWIVAALVIIAASCVAAAGSRDVEGQPKKPGTVFYVDPDWTGTQTGQAANPWTALDRAARRAIDAALANGDVTVYFSAREATADNDEATTTPLSIRRDNTSSHRLTLDGMSKYNTDDAAPAWSDHAGNGRFAITAPYAISTSQQKHSHVTVRGFKVVAGSKDRGGQGIYYWGGDHVVIEHCVVTHARDVRHGPGILFGYAWTDSDKPGNGGCVDVTIRNNVVHHVYGEGIYIGGSHDLDKPAHRDVTIEGNVICDVGVYGGEADAIDVKDGSTNVVVKGNRLLMTRPGAGRDGIAFSSGGLIENNVISNFGRCGITLGTFWNAHAVRDGTVLRGNVVVATGGNPQYSWDYGIVVGGNSEGDQYTNAIIENNTICNVQSDRKGLGTGLQISEYATGARVLGNVIYGSVGPGFEAPPAAIAENRQNLIIERAPDVDRRPDRKR